MSGFINSGSTDTINPGGFLNTTTALGVTSGTLPVDVILAQSLPQGSNFLGYVAIQSGLPEGDKHVGSVTIEDGSIVALQNGTTIGLSGSLPSGTNEIGIVALKNGSVVAIAGGSTVGIAGTVTVQGGVSVTSLPNVTVATLPNVTLVPGQTINVAGSVNIGTMPSVTVGSMPAVTIAPGQSIAVTGVTLSNVGINAGVNHVGQVSIDAALPAGTNAIGTVGLNAAIPTGSNTIGAVGLNAGTNLIGKTDVQGIDIDGVKRQVSVDGVGALLPPTTEVNQYVVDLLANQSTTILAANPDRLMWMVQLVNLDNVILGESGQALASLSSAGTVIISGGVAGTMYTPPFVSTLAVTALCGQTTKIRVTEYSRK